MLENYTDRQIIQRAAVEEGYYKTPRYYKRYIQQEFNRTVSNSSICKTLGTFKIRSARLEMVIEDHAVRLLKSASYDIHMCKRVLESAYDKTK